MANAFLTPSVIAQAALATLYETCVAAQLVHRDYSSEFGAAKIGDTVTIRKPAVFEAKEYDQASGIEIQNATETGVPVKLNHHADTSFQITSRDLTLNIKDFRQQLLDPALESIAQKIDRDILAFRSDITQSIPGSRVGRKWNHPEALIDANTILNKNNVPLLDRHAIVGPTTQGEWLDSDILKNHNSSGDTEALREAYLGRRLFGFDPYWTQNITEPSGANSETGVAFHRTAVALVTRPLELPLGSANAATENYKGFGIRVVIGYDQKFKTDTVSVDTIYGVKVLDPKRAVLIKGLKADAADPAPAGNGS
ncbi:P22 phage major capsid protein family protein [Rhodococcus sp. NPDC056506]|uniref:P22 phage major capsid protein family protein n=1 Tax=Rhodococcus sp. NPDC056506 TaxID=3345844 RepID=UPI00366C64E0